MNIDVLSFGRLTHRIFEEMGANRLPMLDDTGKSLIIRRVAAGQRGELPVLGGRLGQTGYIHEVKSAISEFYAVRNRSAGAGSADRIFKKTRTIIL